MSSKFALVVGSSEYQDPLLGKLTAPGKDVEAFSRVLGAPEIAAFDEVNTLVNPSEASLRRQIGRFYGKGTKDDLLLLYISGHGLKDDWGQLYFAVQDTELDNLIATALPASFIRQVMDMSNCRRQVLILDCCNSGAFTRAKNSPGSSMDTAQTFAVEGYGRVILTASDATQVAWEGDKIIGKSETSLFTHFIIQGLQSGDADLDGDGQVTLDELYRYVYEHVVQATPKQKPQIFADRQQGQLILARSFQTARAVGLPADLLQALESPYAGVRYGVIDELSKLLDGSHAGLSLAARSALEKLCQDDSRRVSQSASQVLANQRQPAPGGGASNFSAAPVQTSNTITLNLAPGVPIELVRIPAGEFLMGSLKTQDPDAFDRELEQHPVTLGDYWIGRYPVTVAQFRAFVIAKQYRTTAEQKGSGWNWNGKEWVVIKGADWQHPRGPDSHVQQKADHPVTMVSWDDALAFCNWASQVAGKTIRLPSEAEWEKAARGADGRIWPWDDNAPDSTRCNFNLNVGDTTPVGKFSPRGDSPYGCVDMAGNTWEWTCSRWGKKPEQPDFNYPYLADDGREKLDSRDWRILRGGSFGNSAKIVRCACRSRGDPDNRNENVGFRVVASPI